MKPFDTLLSEFREAWDGDEAMAFALAGACVGWWEDVDAETALPIRVFKLSDFREGALMAHAWHERMHKFASVKQAKKAGWVGPVRAGTYRIGTYIMRLEQ